MEYVLTTENLSKSYGRFQALDQLSLHVPKGYVYGLVGRNGAGKTTLIRLVCGLQTPSGGTYMLYGKRSGDRELEKIRRRVGAVVEVPSVYQNMTAEENLKQQYLLLGLPSFEGIARLLELVGLSDTGKKKVRNFSLGMRQRLGIALALAGSPDFLILDEPVNGLDPQGIIEMRELLLRLNREHQITILISSHILDELSRLATHYGFLDRGRLVKEMSAGQLEASARKSIRVEVSDIRALVRGLDALGLEYTICSDKEADIYGEISVTRLVLALSKEGCEILQIRKQDESLESYYMTLLGGEDHE